MRKLLLGTTAIAAAATLSANTALADVSLSGGYEFIYTSQDAGYTSAGSSFDSFASDSDLKISFTNKTDSGLTIGMHIAQQDGAGYDETSMSIAGGFGTLILGADDGAGDRLTRTAHDILGPGALNDHGGDVKRASTTLADDNADLVNDIDDANNVTYILPTMGGLTIGASYADAGSGASDNADESVVAAMYSFESGAVKGTIHYGQNSISGATVGAASLDSNSMALDISTGPFRAVMAKAESDLSATNTTEIMDYGVQYSVGNGLTLAAVGTQIEANTGTEASDVTSVSARYTIASGLEASLTYHDYDYEDGTTSTTADDDGSYTQLIIQAKF